MRDFLPDDVRRRESAIRVIKGVYERFGFEPLETPALENIETLLGKYGEEGNKLIYKILKRGEHEKAGEADLALRYDLTVPLARVVAQYQGKLQKIWKRYQIQPVWRADRPARGRFREFYQCDVDSMGSTSPVVEAELCAVIFEALSQLGFSDFVIRVNHRQLLTAWLNKVGLHERQHAAALVTIDKRDKIGNEGVVAELAERGVDTETRNRISNWLGAAFPVDWWDAIANELPLFSESGRLAYENLREIRELLKATGTADKVQLDVTLARGLSYYTGAIMEVNVVDLAGSLGGGGRYDNLVGMFSQIPIPACGFSLGLERILVVMAERDKSSESAHPDPIDVMVTFLDSTAQALAIKVATELRSHGLKVFLYPDAEKSEKHNKYAFARNIRSIAEVTDSADVVTLRDRITRGRSVCSILAAVSALRGLQSNV